MGVHTSEDLVVSQLLVTSCEAAGKIMMLAEVSGQIMMGFSFFFFKSFYLLFMRDIGRERQRHRGRSRLLTWSQMWDSILRTRITP